MFKKLLLFLSILVVIVSMLPFPVSAQDNPWSEVVDANGNILYGKMTDLGEVQEDASWMPNIPFIDGQATYHRYMTPAAILWSCHPPPPYSSWLSTRMHPGLTMPTQR